jgi:predicted nucleic-acid-binding protein
VIGLDTNVLVRYLVQDDPEQSAVAAAVVEGLDEHHRGFISLVVLVELHWVLRRAYGIGPGEVLAVVDQLLRARELAIQESDLVRRSWRQAMAGADLADALVAELGVAAGCEHTVTFDRRAATTLGMRQL